MASIETIEYTAAYRKEHNNQIPLELYGKVCFATPNTKKGALGRGRN